MSNTLRALVVPCMLLPLVACKPKGGDKPKDPNPDFWLVGDQGQMFRVAADGEASTYPLEHNADLRAIACLGHETAWVVGDDSTVLRSRDAGASWDPVDVGVSGNWWALAISEAAHEGEESVWIVGEGGGVRSTDGGETWVSLELEDIPALAVSTDPLGARATVAMNDGSLWSLDEDGQASLVHSGGQPLHGVAQAAGGSRYVAVGAAGTWLESSDGTSWASVEIPTERDLFAVRVSGDGETVIAVGEAGVLVRLEDGELESEELLDPELSLRGLHVGAEGFGQAVGDAGTLLRTYDAGQSWELVALATTATLRGVDDVHGDGHL